MQITKQQIQQFLNAACTGEEASAIAAYLENNPEMLNSYLQEEWNTSTDEGRLTPAEGKMMYQEILQQLSIKRRSVFTLRKTRWVAAAAVLFLAGITALSTKKQNPAKITQTLPVKPDSNLTDQEWKVYLNATGKKKKITLPDSTVVVLAAKSEIRCKQPFPANKREIKMKGQAYFDVHKNQSKPFTVYAGNTATTALGTSFCINMSEKDVTIKLFTGKVMIKPIDGLTRGWDSTVYLLPGQQMQYHISKDDIAVSAFNRKTPDHTPPHSTMLSFNNAPIGTVLNKLSEQYNVAIHYNKKEINGIAFTGTVLPGDSLPVILKIIGKMNGFDITQANGTFTISKQR